MPEQLQGGTGVILRDRHHTPRLRGQSVQHLAALRAGDLGELVGRLTRRGDVADRDQDLDERRQQRDALKRQLPLVDRATDRRGRRVLPALCQPHQRKAGLRFPPAAARLAIGVLRLVEPACRRRTSAWR